MQETIASFSMAPTRSFPHMTRQRYAGTTPKVCRLPMLSTVFTNAIPGHCTRGDQCWFRHILPKVAPDDERIQFNAETCCICLEKPTTYGLLSKSPSSLVTSQLGLNYTQRTAVMSSVSRSMITHCFPFNDTHFLPSASASGVLLQENHLM